MRVHVMHDILGSDTYTTQKPTMWKQSVLIGYLPPPGPSFFLPLGATVRGELWPPEQPASLLAEADYVVSEQFSFYGVRLLDSRPTPNLEDQGIPLRLAPTPWPVLHGW
jgi:hypothetical protein